MTKKQGVEELLREMGGATGPDAHTTYLPRSEWKPIQTLIEPGTQARYTRHDVGYYAIPPMDRIIVLRQDFTPPASWDKFIPGDKEWDSHFLSVFGPEYSNHKVDRGQDPVPITAQMIMAKSRCRKAREGSVDRRSALLWVNWTRITPCWYLMGARENHWLLTEEELGYRHG